jgi:hypothetical protein
MIKMVVPLVKISSAGLIGYSAAKGGIIPMSKSIAIGYGVNK